MRKLARDAFAALPRREPYAGAVWAGIETTVLTKQFYEGDFNTLGPEDRQDVMASLVALLMTHAKTVYDFGAECTYPGDAQFLFTLDEASNTFSENSQRHVYEQKYWIPSAYEKVAGAAFFRFNVRPGLTKVQDMGRIAFREGCGSPRFALLRENMLRFLAGEDPASIEDITARYGTPQPTSVAAGIPNNPLLFGRACYKGMQKIRQRKPDYQAQQCACLERHLRSADLGEVYNTFLDNWRNAMEVYWYSAIITPIAPLCNKHITYKPDEDLINRIRDAEGIFR